MKLIAIFGPLLLCALCNPARAGSWEMAYAPIERPSSDMQEPDITDYGVAVCVDVDVESHDMECEIAD